jgi:hypothetical protein
MISFASISLSPDLRSQRVITLRVDAGILYELPHLSDVGRLQGMCVVGKFREVTIEMDSQAAAVALLDFPAQLIQNGLDGAA